MLTLKICSNKEISNIEIGVLKKYWKMKNIHFFEHPTCKCVLNVGFSQQDVNVYYAVISTDREKNNDADVVGLA